MSTPRTHRFDPRHSPLPAALAFLFGAGLHAVEQALFVRAGPAALLLTAPVVATLAWLRVRDATRRTVLALLAWGALASGLAVLAVYLQVVGYYLPRPLTGVETVAYDLGMFLWFVLGLAAVYTLAARVGGRRALAVALLAPVVQAAFPLLVVVLVETGVYA